MKKQIIHISLHQTAKILSFLVFVITAIIAIPIALVSLFTGDRQLGFMLFGAPFFYLALSYIVWIVYGWIYNHLAPMLGGIEFDLKDIE